MRSRATAAGHAIHPMLIVLPLGLFTTAVIFDIVHLAGGSRNFQVAAAYTMGIGVLGGLLAAVFGAADWLSIPTGTRAQQVGLLHGLGNVVVTVLFGVSWLLRATAERWHASGLALALSFAGLLLSVVTGWLGGELVERLGVSVDEHADLNAPSSLSGRTAGSPRQRG